MPITTSSSITPSRNLEVARAALRVAVPDRAEGLDQNEEWFVFDDGSGWREILLHDYEGIFAVPGLYERLVYDVLRCESPGVVAGLLRGAITASGGAPAAVRLLDFGAGNGCVGEALAERGFRDMVAADIAVNAAEAAERDRPGLYRDYVIGDITSLAPPDDDRLGRGYDAMTCVAALGFGDIPASAFAAAVSRVRRGGWLAFTIKAEFLDHRDDSGFSTLIRAMINTGALKVEGDTTYRHRFDSTGKPIMYRAIVGTWHPGEEPRREQRSRREAPSQADDHG